MRFVGDAKAGAGGGRISDAVREHLYFRRGRSAPEYFR